MGSIKSVIELENLNEHELVDHLNTGLEDYRVEHIAPGTRIIVSNNQLAHKIGVVSGEKIKIKTRSRKMRRNNFLIFGFGFFTGFILSIFSSSIAGLLIAVILLGVLYEIITTPIRRV